MVECVLCVWVSQRYTAATATAVISTPTSIFKGDPQRNWSIQWWTVYDMRTHIIPYRLSLTIPGVGENETGRCKLFLPRVVDSILLMRIRSIARIAYHRRRGSSEEIHLFNVLSQRILSPGIYDEVLRVWYVEKFYSHTSIIVCLCFYIYGDKGREREKRCQQSYYVSCCLSFEV